MMRMQIWEFFDLVDKVAQNSPDYVKIDLSNEMIGDGVKYLANALRHNTVVQEIDITGNLVGWDGMIALCDALDSHPAISVLKIYGNNISDDKLERVFEWQKQRQNEGRPIEVTEKGGRAVMHKKCRILQKEISAASGRL